MYFLFQLFSQQERQRETPAARDTEMTTIDGLQPSPPWTQQSDEWYRSDPEGEENPKQTTRQPLNRLTRTRQEENIRVWNVIVKTFTK